MLKLQPLLNVSNFPSIARRFFVTNGFDGALTMIGLFMGFYLSEGVAVDVALQACLGAAIALFMSGSTSAYISESAERRKEINELENAMAKDMSASVHEKAAQVIPLLVALVNGLSPLLICLTVMTPLWLVFFGYSLPGNVFLWCIGFSIGAIFLLGIYLSTVSKETWLFSGVRSLLIAFVTLMVIYLVGNL